MPVLPATRRGNTKGSQLKEREDKPNCFCENRSANHKEKGFSRKLTNISPPSDNGFKMQKMNVGEVGEKGTSNRANGFIANSPDGKQQNCNRWCEHIPRVCVTFF